jgi:integrase
VASLVDPPAVEPRPPPPWTLAETLRFLDTARRDPLYAAFMLALALGLRRGEIVGLRWVDVELDNRVIYVRRQVQRVRGDLYEDDPKGRRRRPVPLPRICVVALRWQRLRQAALRQAAGSGGRRRVTSSQPERGVWSRRGTSTARLGGWREKLPSRSSACMTPDTVAPRC